LFCASDAVLPSAPPLYSVLAERVSFFFLVRAALFFRFHANTLPGPSCSPPKVSVFSGPFFFVRLRTAVPFLYSCMPVTWSFRDFFSSSILLFHPRLGPHVFFFPPISGVYPNSLTTKWSQFCFQLCGALYLGNEFLLLDQLSQCHFHRDLSAHSRCYHFFDLLETFVLSTPCERLSVRERPPYSYPFSILISPSLYIFQSLFSAAPLTETSPPPFSSEPPFVPFLLNPFHFVLFFLLSSIRFRFLSYTELLCWKGCPCLTHNQSHIYLPFFWAPAENLINPPQIPSQMPQVISVPFAGQIGFPSMMILRPVFVFFFEPCLVVPVS